MPRDSLRSVVYRSLVHCDDPNGVIEGETIRKSKMGSCRKEHQINRNNIRKDSSRSSIYKEEKDESRRDGLYNPSSFQLLEVSKGAENLNQMIDSWSNGHSSFDWQSTDIATGLLKGALDLQESLEMLCKLQEASKYMGQLKRKQKLEFREVGDMVVKTNELALEEKINQWRTRSGRLSVDGSSMNRIEELKKVISSSLVRQNFLPNEENASFHRKKQRFALDVPSTSSNQSSTIYSNNSASVDYNVSSTNQERKLKGRSVIAKLMGMDELPPESEKCLTEGIPGMNIEMPSAKEFFMDRNEDHERQTLKGIIGTMKLEGLLKLDDAERVETHSNLSRNSHSNWSQHEDMPPIVLIKPMHARYEEKEGLFLRQFSCKTRLVYPKEKLIEADPKEESPKKWSIQGGGRQKLEKLFCDEKALNMKEMTKDVENKTETLTKRSVKEKEASNSKEIRKKQEQEAKETITKEQASANRLKVSVPISRKSKQKETTNGKAEKVQKVLPNGRKAVEKESVKSLTMSRSKTQVGATSTKPKKSGNTELTVTKNCIQRPKLARSVPPIVYSSNGQTKNNLTRNSKAVTKLLPVTSITESLQCKDGVKDNTRAEEAEYASTPTTAFSDDNQLCIREAVHTAETDNEEQIAVQKSSLCEVTSQISQHENGTESAEELKPLGDCKTTSQKTEFNLKGLHLTSSSCLSCAEELFDLNINQPMVFETNGSDGTEDPNDRLYLDYANEFMERKMQRTPFMGHVLLSTYMDSRKANISLNQLVEEVCDGVDHLRSYAKVDEGALHTDSIYKMLETDLTWKGVMISDVWDFSWGNGFSLKEADQVVCEVEKDVLSKLIEEVIANFPNSLVKEFNTQDCS